MEGGWMERVAYKKKRMVGGLKYAVFRERMSNFIFRNNDFLFQDFDGE